MNLTAATTHDWYLVACAAGTVLLLLILIAKVRLHPALSLTFAALALGVASGMPLLQVPLSFTAGVGNLMGHIAIVLGLGAVLGRLLATSGGASSLGRVLVENCGVKGLPWGMLALGILVGMPVFFEVGLVLLLPIVAETARRSKQPPILVALPVLAGLSMVHAVFPPHPAALLAAAQFHADLGRTMLWGMVAGLPAAALAGPLLGFLLMRLWARRKDKTEFDEETLFTAALETAGGEEGRSSFVVSHPSGKNKDAARVGHPAGEAGKDELGQSRFAGSHPFARKKAKGWGTEHMVDPNLLPVPASPLRAAAAILLPVALIFLGSWADTLAVSGSLLNQILHLIGSPDMALLIAVLVALFTLGGHIQTGTVRSAEGLRKLTEESFAPIAAVLVILAAAGGLSGVLRDSGAAQATVSLALNAHMQPLVLAWLLAAMVRIAMGSSTVAMAVAAGILAPMAGHLGVRPELLVLATGTGSVILSHVNDPGFWMIQSFFKLELKETLSTWTVLETVLSVAGLGMTLALAALLR